ncbi:hypothetical protein SANTM175S_04250 [Streptomyces antimycoticus]
MESNREPGSPQRRVVIVGGGMAGTRLARQLVVSAGEATLDVTVIGEEPHLAYNRVLLAEVLAGRYAPEVIALPAPAAGTGAGVRRLSGVRVVRVDRPTAEVLCDDGRRVPYDALVLATGSNPVLPPLRGLFEPEGRDDLRALPDGVHAFRTMDDCLALGRPYGPGHGPSSSAADSRRLRRPCAGPARCPGGPGPPGRTPDGTPAGPGRVTAAATAYGGAGRGGPHRVPGPGPAHRRAGSAGSPRRRTGRRIRPGGRSGRARVRSPATGRAGAGGGAGGGTRHRRRRRAADA